MPDDFDTSNIFDVPDCPQEWLAKCALSHATLTRYPERNRALVGLFSGLYAKAGIDTSSHAGRALFITSLADRGISIRIIQKAVGHRSLSATNAYLDARPAEVSAAVELLR